MTPGELDRLATITFEEMDRFFERDSCVLATRVFLAACKSLGVRGLPMSVIMATYTPDMRDHIEAHGCNFWSCDQKIGHGVILGMPPGQRRQESGSADDNPLLPFQGHVVALVPVEEHGLHQLMLVDLTISQMSHPEFGLPVDGWLGAPVNVEWAVGQSEFIAVDSNNVSVRIHAFPGDKWFMTNSPDWNNITPIHEELVDSIVSRFHGGDVKYSDTTLQIAAITGRI